MPPTWQRLPQSGDAPGPRSSHCLVATPDGRLLCFGGELQPRVPQPDEVFAWSAADGAWARLATTGASPGPRVGATAAAVGDKVYVFGGRSGVDLADCALGDLHVLDTRSNTWAALAPPGPSPPRRSYHATAAAAGRVFVFGGCGADGRVCDLWEYDPERNAWQQLPSCSSAGGRGGAVLCASACGRRLYVLGGFNGAEMADTHCFDIDAARWSCCSGGGGGGGGVPDMPLPRSVFGAAAHACGDAGCSHGGGVVTFGGECAPSDKGHAGAGDFCAATLCLCAHGASHERGAGGGEAWHALDAGGEGPGPRGWFAHAALGGCLVLHGGLGGDNERLGDMWRLSLH